MTVSPELKILGQDRFCQLVDSYVANGQMGYIDAIVRVCTETGIEVETVNSLINPRIRKNLKTEASGLNLLKQKRGARLPI